MKRMRKHLHLDLMSQLRRQDRFSKVVENLHLTVDKICQKVEEKSDKSAESVQKLQEIFSNFATNLKASDSHGRVVATKKNKDKKTNPSKLISLGPWVLSKIRKTIIGVFKNCFSQNKFDDDLSVQISICPSQEIYLSHQEKIEDSRLVEVEKFEEKTLSQLRFANDVALFPSFPIHAKSKSPIELDLESFNSILNSYKKLNSPESPPTLTPQNQSFEIPFKPIEPIYAEGQSPWELDKPSTIVSYAKSFSPPDPKLLPKKTRILSL